MRLTALAERVITPIDMSRRPRFGKWLQRRFMPLGAAAILPEVSGRYVQKLLYGGATLLTAFIVLAMAVTVNSRIQRFINEQQQFFLQHREQVKSRVDTYQTSLRNYVANYEALWTLHDHDKIPLERYRQRLLMQQGVTLTESDLTAVPFGVLTTLTAPDQQQHLATLLRLMREVSPNGSLWERETGYFLGGFIYTADERFLATVPPLPEPLLQAARQGSMPEIIRQRIVKVEEELSKYSDLELARQQIFWVQLGKDPFNEQLVTHFASPVFRNGKRVAVIVEAVPFKEFTHLFQNGGPIRGFFVASRLHTHFYGASDEDEDERHWGKVLLTHPEILDTAVAEHPQVARQDGVFFFYQTIPGPNWIAIYAFDWHTILAGLWPELSLLGAVLLMMLLILWAFVVILDRFVFTPLQLHAQRIHESEAFNRTVIDTAPVGLGVVDPVSGEVVLQNEIAANLLQHDLDSGRHFYQRILASSAPHSRTPRGVEFVEATVNDGTGGQRDMVAAFSRTRYLKRDVVLFGLTDISDRKETERLMHEARIAADRTNQAKSMFLATVSHEIRTPLHGALGNLELLAMENLPLHQKERVDMIRRSFDALLALINDILDISKVEANELTLQQEPFSPHALTEQCAQTFAPVILAKNVRFLCLVAPEVPYQVIGDDHRIAQILMNLLGNASKFTESGAIALRVEPEEISGDHVWLRFSVSDSGIGIAAENQQHILEPFSQADGSVSRDFGGTGLGLSLCKRLTDLMGGFLEIDSELDVGSTFTVILPLQIDTESTVEDEITLAAAIDTMILLCDSNAWQKTLLASIGGRLPSVKLIATTEPLEARLAASPTTVLLIACSEPALPGTWLELTALPFSDSVIITPNGPLHPQRQEHGIAVSAYATNALYAALGLCGLHDVSTPASVHAAAQESVKHAERILVVEDDPVSRALIEPQLAALGYDHVHSALNGRQALERCRIEAYDVIISDLNMPIMDGKMLLSALRAEGIMTPVIVNTASSQQDLEANRHDFAHVLHKPVTIGQLGDALTRVLGGKAKSRAVTKHTVRDETVVKHLQAAFLASWEVDVTAMKEAVASGDDKQFQRRLHRLKGALLIMEEHDASAQCEILQLRVKENGCTTVTDLLPRFWTTIQEIVERYQTQLIC
ncbi:hybrid sensor histidine kinase/response regulator [Collimonas silvisoli]|uniref:hybrid sensor histidine kinase/response regulator n=1 Tax=Collimonas silvisoli TaxID=2825884 RepID=UPI001B8B884F|nr:hybrid sensor histidine kinase/response regulator [Collimonas silvisoli]